MKTQLFGSVTLLAMSGISLLCATNPAQASTYTITAAPTDWTQDFSVQKFNSSLGTLTSVTLTLVENTDYKWQLFNNSLNQATFTVSAETDLTLTLPGILGTLNASVSYPSTAFSVAASSSQSVDSGWLSGADSVLLTPASGDLSAFVGTGNLSLSASTATEDATTGTGGNRGYFLSTQTGAILEVTYNYTPVPEPSSLALLGLGGMGVMAMLRRKSR
jgi:hypothetical protein